MDPATAKKVNELAQNLRSLHMAATMEEAISKAKDIILGTEDDDSKSIKELMSEVEEEKEELKKETDALKEIEKDIKDIHKTEIKDEELREEQAEETQRMEQDLEDAEEDAELVKANLDAAELVQEEE